MRFHRGKDGWGRDSYPIPDFAVAGSSDCGPNSPVPTDVIMAELKDCQQYLKDNGIESKIESGESGNVFCTKQWIVVSKSDFAAANKLAEKYLKATKETTDFIHNAK